MAKKTIRWASYNVYEGPVFYGSAHFRMPTSPTEADRILAVITATEGGHWNAVNMYDRCVLTVGLIQWCEAGQYSVSDMLGAVAEKRPNLIHHATGLAHERGYTLRKNARGRWRWFLGQNEVDTTPEQRSLFLLDSDGKKGSWNAPSKAWATRWCKAMAELFEDEEAILIQRDYTVPRLFQFVASAVRTTIEAAPDTPIGRAFVAAYLSYAANNPTWAARALDAAESATKAPPYTLDWLITALEYLTFNAKITIYPARYKAIRPVLERLYGIDIPDFAEQLRQREGWLESSEVQRLLVDLGYDLGSSGTEGDGVDGRWGDKSRAALTIFQNKHGLTPDGYPDPDTNDKLRRVRDELFKIKAANGGAIPPDLKKQVEALVSVSMDAAARAYFEKTETRNV